VNLEEAGLLCQRDFASSPRRPGPSRAGRARVLVTDGGPLGLLRRPSGVLTQVPPEVLVTRVTGAGDTFMAAHIVAEREGPGAPRP
jgi:sugar/nucleoside kinase (ribokinase family)